jgi:hypothetical protein
MLLLSDPLDPIQADETMLYKSIEAQKCYAGVCRTCGNQRVQLEPITQRSLIVYMCRAATFILGLAQIPGGSLQRWEFSSLITL